jgi:hypothetical protein
MAPPRQVDRQLSLVTDAVRAFRSAMEMLSIGESERQQIILKQGDDSLSLEELLGWVEDFATTKGPASFRVAARLQPKPR